MFAVHAFPLAFFRDPAKRDGRGYNFFVSFEFQMNSICVIFLFRKIILTADERRVKKEVFCFLKEQEIFSLSSSAFIRVHLRLDFSLLWLRPCRAAKSADSLLCL